MILYTYDRPFMRKTYEAIDQHVDTDSAYLPLGPQARGTAATLDEIEYDPGTPVTAVVDRVDPEVVVRNHRLDPGLFDGNYDVVHVRHGASVGREEIDRTLDHLGDAVDVALAPGRHWADQYREGFPDSVDVSVIGIPEADRLVNSDPPRERRVLYAPTNHNYGAGSYLNTAEDVLDTFADTEYELYFRPHPMDRIEEPGKSLTDRCRERIAALPNVTFDERETPIESLLAADLLVSDYSGIVTEWLHTDRPLIQLTDLACDREPPRIGTVTDEIDLGLVDARYEDGPPPETERRRAQVRVELGIPMDGQAGDRTAAAIEACTE